MTVIAGDLVISWRGEVRWGALYRFAESAGIDYRWIENAIRLRDVSLLYRAGASLCLNDDGRTIPNLSVLQ